MDRIWSENLEGRVEWGGKRKKRKKKKQKVFIPPAETTREKHHFQFAAGFPELHDSSTPHEVHSHVH